jgi:hypothetical protein
MEALSSLAKEQGYPSAQKLWLAVQRGGLDATRKQVYDLVKRQNARQVFNERPAFKGKVVSTGINDRWAADLVVYSSKPANPNGPYADAPDNPYQFILLVQDLYSRKLFGHALRYKDAHTVTEAFESLLRQHGTPARLDTDEGPEFQGPFNEMLAEHRIAHDIADKRSYNARATLDNAIKVFRQTLARIQATENTRDWAALVPRVLKLYNDTAHAGLVGRAPDDVADDDDLQFTLDKQAAHNLQLNTKLVEGRERKLQAEGHFRVELPRAEFERSFHPKFGGAVHRVVRASHGYVEDEEGRLHPTRHVRAVPAGSENVDLTGLGGGSAHTEGRWRQAIEIYKDRVLTFVGAEVKALNVVSEYMKSVGMSPLIHGGLTYKKAAELMGLHVTSTGYVSKEGLTPAEATAILRTVGHRVRKPDTRRKIHAAAAANAMTRPSAPI